MQNGPCRNGILVRWEKTALVTVVAVLAIPGVAAAEAKIIDIEFGTPPDPGSDTTRTIESLVKVQGQRGAAPRRPLRAHTRRRY